MSNNALKTAFSRFNADYGMVYVLLLLCACFTVATIQEMHPEDAAAGRQLANKIAVKHAGKRVVILTGESRAETNQFAEAVSAQLADKGIEVVRTVQGKPSDLGKALRELGQTEDKPQVIACSRAVSEYGVLRKLDENKSLADAQIVTPDSYWWPTFLTVEAIYDILLGISVTAIIAIGMTLVIITAGIDLSVGSLIALAAVTAALLVRDFAAGTETGVFALTICCLAAIGLCALLGGFSGVMVAMFRMPPFIVTLSIMLIARGLAYRFSASQTIKKFPDYFTTLSVNEVALMFVLFVAAHVMMTRTVLGRYIYAVGGNPEAARLSGVPVKRVLLFCYVACGLLAGVGGVVMASEFGSGAPHYGLGKELEVIAAVVLGGTSLAGGEGKIFGTLIGALILGVMNAGMDMMNIEGNTDQKIVLGLVILAAVLIDVLKKRGWSVLRQDG
jgi:ribose transport system permease protein